jgi:anti-sigma factor RsiW
MNCAQVKKILFSGYIDGEMPSEIRKEVEGHIEKCVSCRVLEKKIREFVVMPLSDAERFTPPERVWENIKNEVKRQSRFGGLNYFAEWVKEHFVFQRPVFAAATVAVLLAVLTLPAVYRSANNTEEKKVSMYLEEEMDFLFSLGEGNGSLGEDIGIPMEDFFM